LDYHTLKAAADFYPEYFYGVLELLDNENSRTDKFYIMNQKDITDHLFNFFKVENQSLLKDDNPEKYKSSIYEKKQNILVRAEDYVLG